MVSETLKKVNDYLMRLFSLEEEKPVYGFDVYLFDKQEKPVKVWFLSDEKESLLSEYTDLTIKYISGFLKNKKEVSGRGFLSYTAFNTQVNVFFNAQRIVLGKFSEVIGVYKGFGVLMERRIGLFASPGNWFYYLNGIHMSGETKDLSLFKKSHVLLNSRRNYIAVEDSSLLLQSLEMAVDEDAQSLIKEEWKERLENLGSPPLLLRSDVTVIAYAEEKKEEKDNQSI